MARAYAWSDRHRDAERELRVLQSHGVRSAAVDSLMHSVREAIDPTSTEAAAWVAERRDYAPYRLALARALVNEHNGWLAAAQYDTLIARRGTGAVPDALALRREQAAALFDAGDRVAGAASLRAALQLSPRDTALRYELAVALSGDERATPQLTEALAHYDTLLARAPSASRFAERARLHLIMSDTAAAEHDLEASIKLHPDASAYVTLGDIAREHGDYARARVMYYARALAVAVVESRRERCAHGNRSSRSRRPPRRRIRPRHRRRPGLAHAHRRRERQPRRLLRLVDRWARHHARRRDERRRRVRASIHRRTIVRALAQPQRVWRPGFVGERNLPRRVHGACRRHGRRTAATRIALALGRRRHRRCVARRMGVGARDIDRSRVPHAPHHDRVASARCRPGWSRPALVAAPTADDVLTEQDFNFTLGGPLGVFDVAATAQQSRFSDGNHRTTWQGYARYPLAPALYAVYEANRITFAERSTRYWDPIDYVGQSAGLEIGDRSRHGVAWSVSALPGVAWSRELPPPTILDGQIVDRSTNVLDRAAFQLATSAEVGWRTPGWEFNTAASYSLGRIGAYRRLGLTLGLRLLQ